MAPVEYEYAGFRYRIWRDEKGMADNAVPFEGQHPAASKDKHRRAAIECFNQEIR